MAGCSKAELEVIINHVVLPPRLPEQPEADTLVEQAERVLVNELLSTAGQFLQYCSPEFTAAWSTVQRMLVLCKTASLLGDLSERHLTDAMLGMQSGDVLPIRIRAQNAAIIFRRLADVVSVECFELSPRASAVIGCKGNLRRTLPAHAISVTHSTATEPTFCRELFSMLKRLDIEVVPEMMPKSKKAGQERGEVRDSCHPGLVSEMVMAAVAAVGASTETLQIQKRIRDDVVWGNSLLPWRRSTLWLVLRIVVHTTLLRSMTPAQAHAQFKNFIINFLTNLTKLTADLDISLDTCKFLQIKIARRVAKLDKNILLFVLEAAQNQATEATERRTKVWQDIQKRDTRQETDIDVTTLEQDTSLSLNNSRAALDRALGDTKIYQQSTVPIRTDYHGWLTFGSDGLPYVNESVESRSDSESSDIWPDDESDWLSALTEYEHWVDQSLSTWLIKALVQPTAMHCTSILRSAEVYKRLALAPYNESPEQLSVMLLTLGDLWYAMDSIAGKVMPLLHVYSPHLSAEVFDMLLLPKKSQMGRLHALQSHIGARHQSTESGSPSIFADASSNGGPNDREHFVYKYFEQSVEHQTLRDKIIAEANACKEEKKREWQRKSAEHQTLTAEMNRLACTTKVDYYGDSVHDKSNCRKCDLQNKIRSLSITIYEWPLPENELPSRLAVFYLQCPEVFVAWQTLTWILVQDLGRLSIEAGASTADNLPTYSGLSSYHTDSRSRIMLASATKSVTASHYRGLAFPTGWESVFSQNGLRWKLYDTHCSGWVSEQTTPPSLSSKCQMLLPEGPYKNLQYAVDTTSHAQNQVLASQIDCSPDLSIHEYIAYGSLRADGEKTQW
ncbi:MAG: hypothetical protein Q9169_005182 [Polycauliona sp. 2 TL-2023]